MIKDINLILEDELTKLVNLSVYEMMNKFEKRLDNKESSLMLLTEDVKEITNKLAVKVIEQYARSIDMIYNNNLRDKVEVKITHANKHKRILSDIGEINFVRKRYVANGEPFYIVDNFLELDKRQRIEKGYQSKIINLSTSTSYNKAAILLDGDISSRTALNIVKRNCGKAVNLISGIQDSKMKYVDKLYIEADEDHVHLKKKNRGIVKLVYVHEGYKYDDVLQKRVLINPRYFSTNRSATYMWTQVRDYIKSRYYPGTPISISGDGASWIKMSLKIFPNAKFQLDKFHVYQTVVRLSRGREDKIQEYLQALKNKDSEFLKQNYYKRYKKDAIQDESSGQMYGILYLLNNLKYINLDKENVCCSAESHVSHILSARMSSRPMTWSKEGANVMATYRAYQANKISFNKIFSNVDTKQKKCATINSTKEGAAEYSSLARIHSSNSVLGIEGLQDKISECLKNVLSKCKAAFSRIL